MHKFIFYFLLPLLLLSNTNAQSSGQLDAGYHGNPVDLVNVFIDTADPRSRWFYFNSACRPFGMVNLSPDTYTTGDWGAGNNYLHNHIRCFSHIHAWEMSGIAVLPATGGFRGHLGMEVYKSEFSRENEVARPGYHKVVLDDYAVKAELTSTTRVGFHRYKFMNPENPHVIFDLGADLSHSRNTDTYMRKVSGSEIEGYTIMAPTMRRPKPITVFFTAEFNQEIHSLKAWKDQNIIEGEIAEVSGPGAGVFVVFPDGTDELLMKVSISYTSIENARLNRKAELAHWDFDGIVKESRDEWNDLLGRIKVKGGTFQQQVKFYSDLWRSLLGRRIVSDVSGNYMDNTGDAPVIRTVPTKNGKPVYPHHNFDALWGCQWSLNILWSMAYPEIMDAFANTMVEIYSNGGLIPRGYTGGNYSFVMIGDPATSFFATAYNQGIRNYDFEKAYEGLRKNAFLGGIRDRAGYEDVENPYGGGMEYYLKQGWVPEGIETPHRAFHRQGAAMTLEYAYQDWCLAQFAKSLGKESDYKLFMERSQNYKHLWNPEKKMMHPREKDGQWIKDFKPVDSASHTRGFVEANSAVYTHFVPHDVAGLTELFGGKDAYTDTLNKYFERSSPYSFSVNPRNMHAARWVYYGNQPGTGMGHMFNHAGAPWLSQKWIREVSEAKSDTTPFGGYLGDEDQGQMAALSVLMAIGLFSVDGGASAKPYYEITTPVFDRVEISLNEDYFPGKTFVIETKNNNATNKYIRSARLNGKALRQCWFFHEDFIKGGKLELKLGSKANKRWGVGRRPGER